MAELYSNKEARTAGERREALQREYGTYVATQQIHIDGTLAFAPGYPVPVSHVGRWPELLEEDGTGTAPVVEVSANGTVGEVTARVLDPDAQAPKKSAKREDWAKYAATKGASDDEVAEGGLTRAELIGSSARSSSRWQGWWSITTRYGAGSGQRRSWSS